MADIDAVTARELDKIQGPAMAWARQTISFALSIRSEDVGRPLDAQQIANLGTGEAEAVAQELWRAALQECGSRLDAGRIQTLLSRQVFSWAGKHRTPGRPNAFGAADPHRPR